MTTSNLALRPAVIILIWAFSLKCYEAFYYPQTLFPEYLCHHYNQQKLTEGCKIRSNFVIPGFHQSIQRSRIKIEQLGSNYLNSLSSKDDNEANPSYASNYDPNYDQNYDQNFDSTNDSNYDPNTAYNFNPKPLRNVQSAFQTAASSVSNKVGKRTSELTSGLTNAAQKSTADFQSFANTMGNVVQPRSFISNQERIFHPNPYPNPKPLKNVQSVFQSAASNVSNEVGKRTSEISSGFASVAERGSSDIQSLANNVGKVAEQSTQNVKRTAIQAQQAVKRSADGAISLVRPGKDIYNLHFFELPSFSTFSPIVQAEEVAQWIDSQAKSGTQMVSSKAKTLVLNFTGKKEYQFGDVSKELVHRVASADINMQDYILVLKILIALGATIGPLAELLPFSFLVEAVNISIEQKVGSHILEVLSKSLDNRIVAALFTSDDKNLLGGVVKKTLLQGVLKFTGKEEYNAGDIQRTLQYPNANDENTKLDIDVGDEFEEWDRMFVEKLETEEYLDNQAKVMDMKIALALEECEKISQTTPTRS